MIRAKTKTAKYFLRLSFFAALMCFCSSSSFLKKAKTWKEFTKSNNGSVEVLQNDIVTLVDRISPTKCGKVFWVRGFREKIKCQEQKMSSFLFRMKNVTANKIIDSFWWYLGIYIVYGRVLFYNRI